MVDRSARQRTVVAGAATAVCATLLLVLFGSAGAGTLPEAQRGNIKCDDYGVDPIGSIEAPGESVGDVTTALQSDGSFDWSISAGAVSLVLVKGGPVTNVYDYRPGAVSDTGLNAAVNPRSGRHYGYSTIRFCVGSIPPTATPIATSTATPTVTPIATSTVTPTVTSTATPTVTPIATSTVTPTVTPALPTPTTTPTPTVTPVPPTPTTTPTPTVTPVPPTPTTTPTPV